MLHYFREGMLRGGEGVLSWVFIPFLVSFSADLICGRHFSAQLRKQKLDSSHSFDSDSDSDSASDSDSDSDCGQLMQMTYTAHFACDPQFLLASPSPCPALCVKSNKCELLLVCLKCRGKGWTSCPAGWCEVRVGGLFAWGHAAFVLEKPNRERGRVSKVAIKIHRNNSNALAEKYLVAFHLHFPFRPKRASQTFSQLSQICEVGKGGGEGIDLQADRVENWATHWGESQDAASQFVATNSLRSAWHLWVLRARSTTKYSADF